MTQFGIPYMGSKAKIAPSICMNFPKSTHFYDLFGGGFAITHYMLIHKTKRHEYFHFNEINKDIVDLIQQAIKGEFSYRQFKPLWVSREDFFKHKDSNAYIRCLWSFGNNQKNYLFSKEIEPYKKSMHMAIVFNQFDDLSKQVFGFDKWPTICTSVKQKRLYLRQLIEHYRKTKIPECLLRFLSKKQLQQLQQLQQLEQLEQLQQLEQLERLQELRRLERLQELQRLERLHFTAIDYRKVEILPNSVIYCDPPYKGTVGYLDEFDHESFLDWAASQPHPVYISEYNIDDDRFQVVYDIQKRSELSSNKYVGNKTEKLYWNNKKLKE